jgi:fatty acid desaturase
VGWFDGHFETFLGVLGVAFAAVLAKQGVAIAGHGLGGWLSGEGQHQTEWDVVAVIALMLVVLPGVLIAFVVHTGERPWQRFKEWRWERAIRRGGSHS